MKKSVLAASALVSLASCTVAAPAPQTAMPASAQSTIAMSPEDVVAGRRAAFLLSTRAIGQVKDWSDGEGDARQARAAAMMLANWAEALPGMFPEGSDIEPSRALPNVWTDRAGFEQAAADYNAAALAVGQTIADGDRTAGASAFEAMAGTCHACHTTYREGD